MEMTVYVIMLCAFALSVAAVALYFLFTKNRRVRVEELTDILNTGVAKRSEMQVKNDAVMQLKNEIAESGAVKCVKLDDGRVRVSIRVVV